MDPAEPTYLDLAPANRNALLGAAVVGAIFGLVPLLSLLVALAAGNGAPAAAVVAVIVICLPLALFGLACGVAWNRARRRGSDWLVVEPDGLRREARTGGFAVPWTSLAGVEVVATEATPGDNPYRIYDDRQRRAGVLTALRFEPTDPAAFAAANPGLAVEHLPPLQQRLVGAGFGLVLPMQLAQRTQLADALARFAGSRFRGVRDETTAGRRAAQG